MIKIFYWTFCPFIFCAFFLVGFMRGLKLFKSRVQYWSALRKECEQAVQFEQEQILKGY